MTWLRQEFRRSVLRGVQRALVTVELLDRHEHTLETADARYYLGETIKCLRSHNRRRE